MAPLVEQIGGSDLCTICQRLPFKVYFTRFQPAGLDYDTLKGILARDGCSFCSLVKHTLYLHYGKEYLKAQLETPRDKPLAVSLYQSSINLDLDSIFGTDDQGRSGVFYLALSGLWELSYKTMREARVDDGYTAAAKLQLLADERDTATQMERAMFGRQVHRETIDWTNIRRWVRCCEGRHNPPARTKGTTGGGEGVPPARQIEALLAIDLDQHCVLPLPPGSRYVALSYMWGKDQKVKLSTANAAAMATPGFLETPEGRPSRTIVHAMAATRHLGCQYLWVDALCIKQDDEANIIFNTGRMDTVYAEAWVTIMAVTGADADAGLPGVMPEVPRQSRQMRVAVGEGLFVANMLDADDEDINRTNWNSRAWTYQERLCSTRMLIFTENQVYYRCHLRCDRREEVHMEEENKGEEEGLDFIGQHLDYRYQLDFERLDLFEIYATVVAEYTRRALTNEGDRIRGFQGVLNRLQLPMRCWFFQGIPTCAFVDGLLWTLRPGDCKAGPRRIAKFPSWSWAGWRGPVAYANGLTRAQNLCECTASQAAIETADGVRLSVRSDSPSWQVEQTVVGESWTRHFDDNRFRIYYTLDERGRQSPYMYPRPLNSTLGQQHPPDEATTGVLRAQGKTAVFRLTKQHTVLDFHGRSTCDSGVHEICDIGVLDSHGRRAGTILVEAELVPDLDGRERRFLAVARSTAERTKYEPCWDDGTRRFRHWTDRHPEVDNGERENELKRKDLVGKTIERWPWCDEKHYDDFAFWPYFDVLLLTDPGESGVVERLGIGKIHVDAFLPIASEELVWLG
ncbi:hypothetical protein MAPG_09470 [Magnaporthiopsis poae ATCC 64411]|uniref:Heterokaryon incompatibility domain-containing protein n=1 Tax=Magnaporthiopsis poae (strain ATCC 64411 / 73-15) TaxID=644358 RepID=A0A0C4EA16_MAGP6|nr:hypothetical protein MAPG_09470 [Magnaporthiopsis poae ATCC 64411]